LNEEQVGVEDEGWGWRWMEKIFSIFYFIFKF